MEKNNQNEIIILSILKRILGSPKQSREGLTEVEFNCPRHTCKNDKGKYNLSFNTETNVFHCWKCKYRGSIRKIVEDYGNEDEKSRIDLIIPKSKTPSKKENKQVDDLNKILTCKFPFGFKKLIYNNKSTVYKEAIKYLEGRKIDKKIIEKYNLGYIEEGYYAGRIMVPSYNSEEQLNYYVGRAFLPGVTPNYLGISKKIIEKSDIIFNESNVNFDLPVYLVEGAFDMFHLYNVVPLLGKIPSNALVKKLLEHKSTIIICLDEDAIKDSIELYEKFISYGLDVYFVEVKQDIAEYYVDYGKEELIKMIKGFRKLDLKYIVKLKMTEKKVDPFQMDKSILKEEWDRLELVFKNFEN